MFHILQMLHLPSGEAALASPHDRLADGLCHMNIQEVPRVLPNSLKARVCAIMSM